MGLADDRLFLVSVGRLAYQKGHDILLLSMPAILKEYPNVVLGIVGNGLIREQLESQIVALNLKDSVKLFGNRGDVIRFLAIADIFILPSRWEGLPIALLEAMSAGLPVVATSVEGVEEVVNPGEHGWLVPVEDSCAIAEAIIDLLRHPEKRRVMGLSSRRRIERDFSIDRMCNQYLDIMLRLHDQYV
jgi:glycosyltransferase involved in cell wall biosynthesis